jgi:hypothetical protein
LLGGELEVHGAECSLGAVRRFAVLTVLALAAAGCGGHGLASPESVTRAWSHALDTGDNERAAKLFAPNAQVVQGGTAIRLRTLADAIRWNASLPCSGRILEVLTRGDQAQATFLLGDRATSACDAPGATAAAIVEVRGGKIVLWHQVPAPQTSGGATA